MSRRVAKLEFDRLITDFPDIELVVLTSGADQREIWLALSRSDVAIVDEELVLSDDGRTLGMLVAGNPGVRFLVVMKNYNEHNMLRVISQGVRGIMMRRELPRLLGKAVRQIQQGEVWMPRDLFHSLRDAINREDLCVVKADERTSWSGWRIH